MNFEVLKIEVLSGRKASIYSVIVEGDDQTLFNQFVDENIALYADEVDEILARIEEMGTRFGAREQFFKIGEAGFGDLVCALYDIPGKSLDCIVSGMGVA